MSAFVADQDGYCVVLCPVNIVVTADGYISVETDCTLQSYGVTDGVWEHIAELPITAEFGSFVSASSIVWSSADILNSDGTTYLAASSPIPLDGMNVIEWDGNSEDMEMAALFYAKLSDCVPTVEEVANSVIVCVYGEEERVIDQPIVFVESDMPEGSYMLGETGEDGDPVCFILGLAKEMETEEEVVPIGLYSASFGDYLYTKLLAYTPATTEEPETPAPTPPSPQTAFCIGKAFGRMIRNAMKPQ